MKKLPYFSIPSHSPSLQKHWKLTKHETEGKTIPDLTHRRVFKIFNPIFWKRRFCLGWLRMMTLWFWMKMLPCHLITSHCQRFLNLPCFNLQRLRIACINIFFENITISNIFIQPCPQFYSNEHRYKKSKWAQVQKSKWAQVQKVQFDQQAL